MDCGINLIEEINFVNELNLDFIIIDYYEIIGGILKVFVVINFKREENIYFFKYFVGVGIVFMLIYVLYI